MPLATPTAEATKAAATSTGSATTPRPSAALRGATTGLLSAPAVNAVLFADGILENGSRGYAVKVLQTALNRAGYRLRGGADGHYGPATRNVTMRFQRDHGMIPTGLADRDTLMRLDEKLLELNKGDRTEALPAPRPLRGTIRSYLGEDGARAAFDEAHRRLAQLRDRSTTAPEASVDDYLALLDLLETHSPAVYADVLRGLAATRETNAWAPTMLDLFLALPSHFSEQATIRSRVCEQLLEKLNGDVANLLTHASPDSVSCLKGADRFDELIRALG